jgi:hypothetical protein
MGLPGRGGPQRLAPVSIASFAIEGIIAQLFDKQKEK